MDISAREGPLVPAFFLARPNRFTVEAVLRDGRRVAAHLADPGRLRELLIPGAPLRLRPAPEGGPRRTRHTVALVRSPVPPFAWVSVDTSLPNRLAEEILWRGDVEGIGHVLTLRREYEHAFSRFDFLLARKDGAPMLVEVKSVTLVEDRVARFPDAPTARGARHVRELAEYVRSGGCALLLFVVQREDAVRVEPNPATDPGFAAALASAEEAGVLVRAARFRLEASGRPTYLGPLPVRAAPVAKLGRDPL
jgi:sugar fermentation stimulation protein A